jgi:glycosyltransferase involved in cell wall biosynthesis
MTGPDRILMTADAVGGVWRYAIDVGRELATRGVRTTLAVMGPAPTPAQRAEASDAQIKLIDRPYRLEWMDAAWDDVASAGAWLLDLEQQVRPAVVHLNGYAHASLPWSCPVMVVAHSCVRTWWRSVRHEPPPPDLDRYTAAVRSGLASAQIVVAPTHAMAAALESEYGAVVRVQVVPNGRVTAPATEAPTAKEPFVLAAGRVWDEAKNIAALCAVADTLPWPVYVAGESQCPDGRVCSPSEVHLLGRVAAAELECWYRRSSIYALPAFYEPFGLSVLEAAAAGCALVLGDIPSLRENWDGAAVFVAPDDRGALAAAIRRLIAHPDMRAEIARLASARAATLTIGGTVDRYLQLYQALTA